MKVCGEYDYHDLNQINIKDKYLVLFEDWSNQARKMIVFDDIKDFNAARAEVGNDIHSLCQDAVSYFVNHGRRYEMSAVDYADMLSDDKHILRTLDKYLALDSESNKFHIVYAKGLKDRKSTIPRYTFNMALRDFPCKFADCMLDNIEKEYPNTDDSINFPLYTLSKRTPFGSSRDEIEKLIDKIQEKYLPRRVTDTELTEALMKNPYSSYENLAYSVVRLCRADKDVTPLMLALLDKGAKCEGAGLKSMTSEELSEFVFRAADSGNADLLKYLRENGVSLLRRDKNGNTPLHRISIAAPAAAHCVSILIAGGCSVNDRNNSGNTPPMLAVEDDNIVPCETMLKYSPDLTIKNLEGKDVFDLAAENIRTTNDYDIVRAILAADSKVRRINPSDSFDLNNAAGTYIEPGEVCSCRPVAYVCPSDYAEKGAELLIVTPEKEFKYTQTDPDSLREALSRSGDGKRFIAVRQQEYGGRLVVGDVNERGGRVFVGKASSPDRTKTKEKPKGLSL